MQSISDDLGELLSLPAAEFWDVAAHDTSLHACLDSYLRYKRSAGLSGHLQHLYRETRTCA